MKEIIREPNPLLRKKSKRITKITPEIRVLAKEMIDTMRHSERPGVGLAAPQVGELIRLVVIAMGEVDYVLINPEIIEGDNPHIFKEGCLSVPGIWANIIRPKRVKFRYTNLRGKQVEGEDDGFFARVLQHEIDHLDGKLFIDYVKTGEVVDVEEGFELPESLKGDVVENREE
ncbi:MAG TPA: peptide deformylase [Caldisericia bacterium]|nr:peptide deformylase [Caldisericia bacterium]HPF48769.1 peptide deformylase [Caldisericia bacterium]HPI83571.1 peptide deformylase [Caldisericia bacterium]HPQ93224.1 peptide deformylase [Caldisericia bacterium]HRV74943.1 peptide deformylase [Caldisericia bacterium]